MLPRHRPALRTRAASCAPLRPTLEPYHTARAVVHHSKFRWLMSALGHKRTLEQLRAMSALPPKADIETQSRDVRFVPKADSCAAAKEVLIRVTIRRGQRSLHAQGLATSPTGSPGNRGNHAPCDRSEGGCVDCRRR